MSLLLSLGELAVMLWVWSAFLLFLEWLYLKPLVAWMIK